MERIKLHVHVPSLLVLLAVFAVFFIAALPAPAAQLAPTSDASGAPPPPAGELTAIDVPLERYLWMDETR